MKYKKFLKEFIKLLSVWLNTERKTQTSDEVIKYVSSKVYLHLIKYRTYVN